MVRLTLDQAGRLSRAAVLQATYADALSEHEEAIVGEAVARFRRDGRQAVVTAYEWPVIETSIGAMEAVRSDRLADGQAVAGAAS